MTNTLAYSATASMRKKDKGTFRAQWKREGDRERLGHFSHTNLIFKRKAGALIPIIDKD